MDITTPLFAGQDQQHSNKRVCQSGDGVERDRLHTSSFAAPTDRDSGIKKTHSISRLVRRRSTSKGLNNISIRSSNNLNVRIISPPPPPSPTSVATSVASTNTYDATFSVPTSPFHQEPSADQVPYMPPELLGEISTFVHATEIRNVILANAASSRRASSRSTSIANILRVSYLRRNYAYLAYSWTLPYSKRLQNVKAWMEVNSDWRDLYNDQKAMSSGIFGLMFGNLMRATELGHVDIVQHLVEHRGADVNQEEQRVDAQRHRNATVRPIMIAFKLPDSAVLRYYLTQEVRELDLNYVIYPECGLRFLHQIVSLRHVNRASHLRLLLKRDDIDANVRVDNGMTPLHLFLGRRLMPPDVVRRLRYLLQAGADPNLQDNAGHTPLQTFKKRKGDVMDKSTRKEIKALLRRGCSN